MQYAPVDAADGQSMRRPIEYRRSTGLPDVRGVFHTAGVFLYKAIGETTLRDLEAVLRPKVQGGRVLDGLFGDDDLDYFVLFSSGNALLASPQVAAGAAANAGLDAIARGRRRRGGAALSVNWGFWTDRGMAARAGADLGRNLIPRGMSGFTAAEALAVLDHLLATNAEDTVVMPVDWAAWRAAYPAAAASPLLRDVVDDASAPVSRSSVPISRTVPSSRIPVPSSQTVPNPLAPHLRTTPLRTQDPPHPQRPSTSPAPAGIPPPLPAPPPDPAGLFLAQVAAILRTGPDRLDPDRDLTSQGLDSLMAAQLRQEVQRASGVLLPVSKILSRATLSELAAGLRANT